MESLQTAFNPVHFPLGNGLGAWTEIIFKGRIEASTIDKFMAAFDRQLKNKLYHIILNMNDVEYITSTGLGGLIKYHNLFQDQGGKMILLEPPETVFGVLSLLGFQDVLHIFKDMKEIETFLAGQPAGANPVAKVETDKKVDDSGIFSVSPEKFDAVPVLGEDIDVEVFDDIGTKSGPSLPNAAVAYKSGENEDSDRVKRILSNESQPLTQNKKKEPVVEKRETPPAAAKAVEKKTVPLAPRPSKPAVQPPASTARHAEHESDEFPVPEKRERRGAPDRRMDQERRAKQERQSIELPDPIIQPKAADLRISSSSANVQMKNKQTEPSTHAAPQAYLAQQNLKPSTKPTPSPANSAQNDVLLADIDKLDEDMSTPNLLTMTLSCLSFLVIAGIGSFFYYKYFPQAQAQKIIILEIIAWAVVLPTMVIYLALKFLFHKKN